MTSCREGHPGKLNLLNGFSFPVLFWVLLFRVIAALFKPSANGRRGAAREAEGANNRAASRTCCSRDFVLLFNSRCPGSICCQLLLRFSQRLGDPVSFRFRFPCTNHNLVAFGLRAFVVSIGQQNRKTFRRISLSGLRGYGQRDQDCRQQRLMWNAGCGHLVPRSTLCPRNMN